ncbi:mannonate dehydratase [Clostridiaceae bacterium]|nr:mannonate dehydratase [Clostridiaceae bacterium]RKI17493.1 mannonate dehydratase [bacterium 1XD21-70]
MILTDYLRSTPDLTWEYAKQCGISHATIRLPEDPSFTITNRSCWRSVCGRYWGHGLKPAIIEPLPNELHDHIKAGDSLRDECIGKFLRMIELMDEFDIRILCFNFMAHVGWTRIADSLKERGGARVTGFCLEDYVPSGFSITEGQLWENYAYFLKAVVPHAEKHNVYLALHPDDPPLARLGDVSRIMTSYENIRHAIYDIMPSPNLGITMCQATFHMMGEDLFDIIPKLAEKIFFIHFRNVSGTKENFRETFHDNGVLPMVELIRLYKRSKIECPIRVDHVPTMAGEEVKNAGYDTIGRLYAIGYLKGLLEGC